MSKISNCTNISSLSKTLRFKLIPVGKTKETFEKNQVLLEDEKRSDEYSKAKWLMDKYYREFIETALCEIETDSNKLNNIEDYYKLYRSDNKSEDEKKKMSLMESAYRKQITKSFIASPDYNKLFGADIIRELMSKVVESEEDKKIVHSFSKFTTYFTGFFANRKNMFSEEAKSTSIAYRCIDENLPKFLDNISSFEKLKSIINKEIEQINADFEELTIHKVEDLFTCDFFRFVLTQSGINLYNSFIGGYTCSDGTKIKGLNEYINSYNQKAEKSKRLPLIKPLFKQILSESGDKLSFIPEKCATDDEALSEINDFYKSIINDLSEIEKIFNEFESYNTDGIYILNGLNITTISNAVFGSWSLLRESWNTEYAKETPIKNPKQAEKYFDKQDSAYKEIKSFSISYLQNLGDISEYEDNKRGSISDYFKTTISEQETNICTKYEAVKKLLEKPYTESKKLSKNDAAIGLIKDFLDSIKALEHTLKTLLGTGKEENKDNVFYGRFLPCYENISRVGKVYDKVRNYITQKPYSTNKIKLNFDNPQFLGGWDKNKERDYRAVLLEKEGKYYLAIMDKTNNKAFMSFPSVGPCYTKIDYKLLPGPNKMLPKVFFADSNIGYYNPSEHIIDIRNKETFKKGKNFNLQDCHDFIDFFKESISKHPDWPKFGFEFCETSEYNDISEFYKEVKEQGYSIAFSKVSQKYIDDLINKGELYLFEIYNKDFSEYSKGTPSLHTLYFKMLFNEKNLENVVYQLNGGAEMFYRKASISENERITHSAKIEIKNKNSCNHKQTSIFDYDLIKDKRFTSYQFSLHLPITLNFKADSSGNFNLKIRKLLKDCDNNYVIGIDRGERNLLYISVIDGKGRIVEQYSLNEIVNEYNGKTYKTDYLSLLEQKEGNRDKARKNWTTIENIKELKEGYMSQVVHKICQLVIKYDAVIALENLNSGFKNSRKKVERQVYQKFEKMLTDKLSYLVDKKLPAEEIGGLLNAYQLTNNSNYTKAGIQNGIIFYIPAWLTSKIDPSTGFVDLLKPRYTNAEAAKDFFSRFRNIEYNASEDMFEFSFRYSDFPKGCTSFKNDWTVCTNGERIRTFRNPKKNNEWDHEYVQLTEEFKKLFESNGIDIGTALKENICSQNKPEFFKELTRLFALTLQMRNSITNNVDVDYLISPVRNKDGRFYDSREYEHDNNAVLPKNADANGAYNIARKVLWAIDVLKNTDDDELTKAKISITNKDWLEYTQR